jgi:hypothetical protein
MIHGGAWFIIYYLLSLALVGRIDTHLHVGGGVNPAAVEYTSER